MKEEFDPALFCNRFTREFDVLMHRTDGILTVQTEYEFKPNIGLSVFSKIPLGTQHKTVPELRTDISLFTMAGVDWRTGKRHLVNPKELALIIARQHIQGLIFKLLGASLFNELT
jgi:hypothetical protein